MKETKAKQNKTFDAIQKDHRISTTNIRSYDHVVVELFAKQRIKLIKKVIGSWQSNGVLDVSRCSL
jgi:hypothetical protein